MKLVEVNGYKKYAEEFAGTIEQLKAELENERNFVDEGEGGYQTQSINAELNIVDWNQESAIVEAEITTKFLYDEKEQEEKVLKYFSIEQSFIEE